MFCTCCHSKWWLLHWDPSSMGLLLVSVYWSLSLLKQGRMLLGRPALCRCGVVWLTYVTFLEMWNRNDHTGSLTLSLNSCIRELKQPQWRRQQKAHKFAHWKNSIFARFVHVHFSSFDILKTFLFFLRREMTCFAVVGTTWAYDDKCSILSSYVSSAGSNLIPGQLEDIFQA